MLVNGLNPEHLDLLETDNISLYNYSSLMSYYYIDIFLGGGQFLSSMILITD